MDHLSSNSSQSFPEPSLLSVAQELLIISLLEPSYGHLWLDGFACTKTIAGDPYSSNLYFGTAEISYQPHQLPRGSSGLQGMPTASEISISSPSLRSTDTISMGQQSFLPKRYVSLS